MAWNMSCVSLISRCQLIKEKKNQIKEFIESILTWLEIAKQPKLICMLLQFYIDAILQYAEKHVMLKNQLKRAFSWSQLFPCKCP